jgi:SAM-dependent methyltransferase
VRCRFRDLLPRRPLAASAQPAEQQAAPADEGLYGESYFRRRGGKKGASGYGTYRRLTSNARIAAYVLWRFLPFDTSFDVGAATGFLVESLLELGYDAHGCDISTFAVENAPPEVRPRLSVVDLGSPGDREQLAGRHFDLVTALEVLEHLDPDVVPDTLRFLRTLCDGYLVATIPSIGVNPAGPDGIASGKVREDRLAHYEELHATFEGPVPPEDLMLDTEGTPIEGHICVASFAWWTRQFEAAGFRRLLDVERLMHPVLGRYELSVGWNLYVFHVDDREPAPTLERPDEELARVEVARELDQRPIGGHSINLTRRTVGEEGVEAIVREYDESQARAKALRQA